MIVVGSKDADNACYHVVQEAVVVAFAVVGNLVVKQATTKSSQEAAASRL